MRDLGPGQVLVLMRFGIAAQEAWFRDVIAPVVESFGTCVRMTMPLDDWQSDVHRAIERADAVIMELSQHEGNISRHVLWEVNQMWRSFIDERLDRGSRAKMLFMVSGLEHVRSQNPRPGFVYSSEVGPDWIANMPKSARRWEIFRGFRSVVTTRRTRRAGRKSPRGSATTSPVVQSIPAPITDADVVARAETLLETAPPNETVWVRAIAARNFEECGALAREGAPPMAHGHSWATC